MTAVGCAINITITHISEYGQLGGLNYLQRHNRVLHNQSKQVHVSPGSTLLALFG